MNIQINLDRNRRTDRRIAVSSPSFKGNEKKYVLDCLDRGWITQGEYVKRFEERFAEICGCEYVIACSSGTAALHLALLEIGIGPSDSVIVPSLTYVATANAASYCGARIYFCDIDANNWCMSMSDHRRVINSILERHDAEGLSALIITIPVHLYDSLVEFNSCSLCTVVDSSHVPGKGTIGFAFRTSTHSFYASKIIACGEGGAITTNDAEVAARLRLYRGQGATTPGRYHHSVIGYNYRMTDLQAAVGLAQLERIEENLSIRREIVNRYRSNLANSPITLQGGQRASGWTCAVLVPEGADRDKIMGLLLENEIETRPFFEPIPSLPPYQDCGPVPPVAAEISKRGICLPTHTEMSLQDVDYISSKLLEAVA